MNPNLVLEMMELATTNPSAVWTFWYLVSQRNENTGISTLSRKALTRTELRRVESGMPFLYDREMVTRVGKGLYVVNEELLSGTP